MLITGAGLIVVLVATAVWAGVRIHRYDDRQRAVIAHYDGLRRQCLVTGSAATCDARIYGACSQDPFWKVDPPFGLLVADPISTASSQCQAPDQRGSGN